MNQSSYSLVQPCVFLFNTPRSCRLVLVRPCYHKTCIYRRAQSISPYPTTPSNITRRLIYDRTIATADRTDQLQLWLQKLYPFFLCPSPISAWAAEEYSMTVLFPDFMHEFISNYFHFLRQHKSFRAFKSALTYGIAVSLLRHNAKSELPS